MYSAFSTDNMSFHCLKNYTGVTFAVKDNQTIQYTYRHTHKHNFPQSDTRSFTHTLTQLQSYSLRSAMLNNRGSGVIGWILLCGIQWESCHSNVLLLDLWVLRKVIYSSSVSTNIQSPYIYVCVCGVRVSMYVVIYTHCSSIGMVVSVLFASHSMPPFPPAHRFFEATLLYEY